VLGERCVAAGRVKLKPGVSPPLSHTESTFALRRVFYGGAALEKMFL
jgi:hypothetical protein